MLRTAPLFQSYFTRCPSLPRYVSFASPFSSLSHSFFSVSLALLLSPAFFSYSVFVDFFRHFSFHFPFHLSVPPPHSTFPLLHCSRHSSIFHRPLPPCCPSRPEKDQKLTHSPGAESVCLILLSSGRRGSFCRLDLEAIREGVCSEFNGSFALTSWHEDERTVQ